MGDVGDYWREHREYQQKLGESQRELAGEDFDDMVAFADKNELELKKISDIQYQLIPDDGSWLLNIYPDNRRLYHDPNLRGPFIKVEEPFCLMNVIKGAIKAQKKRVKQLRRNNGNRKR